MKNYTNIVAMTRQQADTRIRPDVYTYNRHRWKWLNRIRWWIHQRLTSPAFEETYKTISIDHEGVLDLLNRSRGDMRRFFDAHGGTVYMGPKEFFLMHDELDRNHWSQYPPMSIAIPPQQARAGSEVRYLGMTVKMLPWMTGVLLVPKDESP